MHESIESLESDVKRLKRVQSRKKAAEGIKKMLDDDRLIDSIFIAVGGDHGRRFELRLSDRSESLDIEDMKSALGDFLSDVIERAEGESDELSRNLGISED